jgi:hypothetical protein
MPAVVYRYQFSANVPVADIESTWVLTVLSCECLYSEARVRLEATHSLDAERRMMVIDASTKVGRTINQVFAGLMLREFGNDAFSVERLDGPRPLPVAA